MNAESTPIRGCSKPFFEEEFLELTPIKEKKIQEECNSKIKLQKKLINNFTAGKSMSSVLQSQKRKKNKIYKTQKKICGNNYSVVNYSVVENNEDCEIDSEESTEKLLYRVIENSNENSPNEKNKIQEKFINNVETNPNIKKTITDSLKVNESNSFIENTELSKLVKNDSVNKILSVSDVMKWSEDSLVPNEESNLSNIIKKKLLGNSNNKEVIKSQSTGWTQLNWSRIEESNESDFAEVGPFYGLPSKVQQLYEEQKGIRELYSWQKECLNLNSVKNHKNLVYALPTSGGKTLVAEILILREIFCYKRNVLFILPFVSIVQEKMRDFSQLALELGFFVEEYAAGKGCIPPKKHRKRNSLFIATIEKASVIINSLIEMKRLEEIGLIVVDELHLLAEDGRGATLETLLTHLLYCGNNIQVIGMTATIGNLEEVAKFLKAESYSGNFRPVQLSEYVMCGKKIYEIDLTSEKLMKEVRSLKFPTQDVDPDGIGLLVQEIIPKESALIFCPTKKNCENVAVLLCNILPKNLLKHKEEEKRSLYRALVTETNDQICPTLSKTIPFGVAYHHSGLTAGERKLLEESFKDETLSVICCTSTLAAGVNLPAKRVILRSPYVGTDFINLSKYKQMVGRAGRTGFGSKGESYLICQPMECAKVENLFRSRMDEAVSKMDLESCKGLVLSAIGLGTATTRRTLRELLSYSLLHLQGSRLNKDTNTMTDVCISKLYKQGALKIKGTEIQKERGEISMSKLQLNATQEKKSFKITNDSPLVISRLGRAAMKGGLSMEKAHDLYSDLIKAQASLVLLTGLHLLYLITPYDLLSQIKPNFSVYFNVYIQLDSKEVHTAKIVGITEFVMSKLATGIKPKSVPESLLGRFYIALILNELWKQQTIWDVAVLFQLPRGLVQTLMTSASTFANSVLRFCEELEELWSFKSLLNEFAPRLAHCCSAELLPLLDLPAVKRGRAKQLFNAGYKTLQNLAGASPSELVRSVDRLPLRVASQIIAAAKLQLMEKAENLREEAEDVLEGLAEKSAPRHQF